ncbi:YdcF family protein [Brevibacillus sp. SYSU BS000544]|uniref:YdcF family protein n=1 Tax=Brevibacillus sp. SYSU BS000544 TaxID=3416443 RepID=UPI003CE53B0C
MNVPLLRRALIALLSAGVLWSVYCVQYIWYVSTHAAPRQADVAIVLGAAVWGDKPSPSLRERLDKAISLYEEKYVPMIIVSGGLGDGKQIDEATAMQRYLVEHGVPESAILKENESRDTVQNLTFSQRIMTKHQMNTALVVSHGFHLARSVEIARTVGIDAFPIAVETHVLFIPYFYAREVLAYTVWLLEKTETPKW